MLSLNASDEVEGSLAGASESASSALGVGQVVGQDKRDPADRDHHCLSDSVKLGNRHRPLGVFVQLDFDLAAKICIDYPDTVSQTDTAFNKINENTSELYSAKLGKSDSGSLILPKTANVGILIDEVTPTWGWRDITAEVTVKGAGAANPTFAIYTGTVMQELSFSPSALQECFINFHLPHDYVQGTPIHIHSHWSNAAVAPNTGNVVWGFDYSYAKGHQQQAFPAFANQLVTQACLSLIHI